MSDREKALFANACGAPERKGGELPNKTPVEGLLPKGEELVLGAEDVEPPNKPPVVGLLPNRDELAAGPGDAEQPNNPPAAGLLPNTDVVAAGAGGETGELLGELPPYTGESPPNEGDLHPNGDATGDVASKLLGEVMTP